MCDILLGFLNAWQILLLFDFGFPKKHYVLIVNGLVVLSRFYISFRKKNSCDKKLEKKNRKNRQNGIKLTKNQGFSDNILRFMASCHLCPSQARY